MLRLSVTFVPTVAPKAVRSRRVVDGLGFLRYRMTHEIPRSLPNRRTTQYSIRLTARDRKRFMFCQELKLRRCGTLAPDSWDGQFLYHTFASSPQKIR